MGRDCWCFDLYPHNGNVVTGFQSPQSYGPSEGLFSCFWRGGGEDRPCSRVRGVRVGQLFSPGQIIEFLTTRTLKASISIKRRRQVKTVGMPAALFFGQLYKLYHLVGQTVCKCVQHYRDSWAGYLGYDGCVVLLKGFILFYFYFNFSEKGKIVVTTVFRQQCVT